MIKVGYASILAFILKLSASIASGSRGDSQWILQGTLRTVHGQLINSREQHHELFLETNDTSIWTLELPLRLSERFDAVKASGMQVEVQGTRDPQGRHLVLDNIPQLIEPSADRSNALQGGSRTLLQQNRGSAPQGTVTMIVFLMDLSPCGTAGPATDTLNMTEYLGTSQPQNLAGMYSSCTLGNVNLDAANSVVYNIPFPCSGTLSDGTPFTTNTCNNQVYNWQEYAAEYAENVLGVNLAPFFHRVLVLPNNYLEIMTGCMFSGLSSQGKWSGSTAESIVAGNSWGYGLVWLGGLVWNGVPSWFHELGHNMGFYHARSEIQPFLGDTDDYACSMASWGGVDARCYNAPHMWTAGWAMPYAQLDISSFYPGSPAQLLSIPVQPATQGPTGILINNNSTSSFSLSYRVSRGMYERPFINLATGVQQGVMVHRLPSGVPTTDTAIVGALFAQGTSSWVDPASLFSVTLLSMDGSMATVALCKRISLSTSCYTAAGSLDTSSPPPQSSLMISQPSPSQRKSPPPPSNPQLPPPPPPPLPPQSPSSQLPYPSLQPSPRLRPQSHHPRHPHTPPPVHKSMSPTVHRRSVIASQNLSPQNTLSVSPKAGAVALHTESAIKVQCSGDCTGEETQINCPRVCPGSCGDGLCNLYHETCTSCPQDCAKICLRRRLLSL